MHLRLKNTLNHNGAGSCSGCGTNIGRSSSGTCAIDWSQLPRVCYGLACVTRGTISVPVGIHGSDYSVPYYRNPGPRMVGLPELSTQVASRSFHCDHLLRGAKQDHDWWHVLKLGFRIQLRFRRSPGASGIYYVYSLLRNSADVYCNSHVFRDGDLYLLSHAW